MRILGTRFVNRSAPRSPGGNELIARADYHPLRRSFPDYPFTVHYHLGPNSNQKTHYVVWPEIAVI